MTIPRRRRNNDRGTIEHNFGWDAAMCPDNNVAGNAMGSEETDIVWIGELNMSYMNLNERSTS